jgi:hypothetical protein
MTQQTVGVDWPGSLLNKFLGNRVRKGGLVALLMRDYQGAATDLSPGGTFISPFALDGFLRNDLLINTPATVSATNLGWYLVGALSPDGPSITPNITLDETEILQSNEDILAEITKNSADIAFMAYESKAVTDALENNQPLSNLQDDGAVGYMSGGDADADLIERQIMLIRAHKADGLREFTVRAFPRVTLSKLNKRTWNKKTVDAVDVVYKRLLDPFAIDLTGKPKTDFVWRDGPGWRAAGGIPVVSTSPTTAAATSTGKATLSTPDATGVGDPFTYGAESTIDDGVTWTVCTLDNPGAVVSSSGTTTVKVKTVTAGATKFRIVVTGTNGAVAKTVKSSSVTIT